ncbi:Cullin binding-domain-containing protein [Geopyxis carbonaria]|nr:Cullin binding-domain-containing protein [Geopyxis carbonaria]
MPPKKKGKPAAETELASSATKTTRRSKADTNPVTSTRTTRATAAKYKATTEATTTAPVETTATIATDPTATSNGKRKRVSNPKPTTAPDSSDSEDNQPIPVKPRKSVTKMPSVMTTKNAAATKQAAKVTSKSAVKASGKVSAKAPAKAPSKAPLKAPPKAPVKVTTPPKKDSRRVVSVPIHKFCPQRCEEWFLEYAVFPRITLMIIDALGDGKEIDAVGIDNWLKDLGVHSEGAAMFCLLWRFRAKSTMTITKTEFLETMTSWGIDSNDKLKARLPVFLQNLCPKPVSDRAENPAFLQFYKWCFSHFKASEQAKNIGVDVATVLFQTLFDNQKYRVDWDPSASCNNEDKHAPRLNHVDAFVKYLNGEQKPVAVITKDQYEQFYHFNKDVPWDLKGYSELTSTWPTLMDNYVSWKKDLYPLPESSES